MTQKSFMARESIINHQEKNSVLTIKNAGFYAQAANLDSEAVDTGTP